jgi:hypothetical protein
MLPLAKYAAPLALAALAFAALLWLRHDAREDGRADAERAVIERSMEARDEADRAAADFRGDGAARRLRDGGF